MGNTNEREALKSIAMPFPPYNTQNPALWFRQIESCFYCTGITEELLNDETADKYSQLKTKIIGIQSTKNELEKQQIGDRKPSEFLRCLEEIASKHRSFPTHLIRSIWISSVKPHVCNVLRTNPNTTLERLCFIADILHSEDKKKQQQQANKPQDGTLYKNYEKHKKVTLEVNCIKLCEAMENLNLEKLPFPPYNAENPSLWFQQIESCFHCTGATDEVTRYHILVSRLEPDVAELIADILARSDGGVDQYKKLKTMIIDNQKTKNELVKLQIGECKPSVFLSNLQRVAGRNPVFPQALVKSIWLSSVTSHIEQVESINLSARLTDIAKLADKLHLKAKEKSQKKAKTTELVDATPCNGCSKKVYLQVNCVKLCEVMENINWKKPDTQDNSTQTELYYTFLS
nr:unnamed protein product [Callosobruchus chinensis]